MVTDAASLAANWRLFCPLVLGQRVSGDEGVWPGIERAPSEVRNLRIELAAIVDTCDLLSLVMPDDSTRFSMRRVLTPSK